MNIKAMKRVVRVHVEIKTDIGEFQVCQNGSVYFRDEYESGWRDQDWINARFSNMVEPIREAAMEIFDSN